MKLLKQRNKEKILRREQKHKSSKPKQKAKPKLKAFDDYFEECVKND